MDTSVEITYPDGSKQQYESLQIASEKSGLSEASIKVRCNKGKAGSFNKKDKIHCRWINESTFRHYQAKKSKNKGSGFEAEVVKRLKDIGYANVCRSAGESKSLDNKKVDIADPSGELDFAIQCKHLQNFPNYFSIKESCSDPRDFVLLWKKSAGENSISPGTVAIIDIDLFFKLLKLYHGK